MCAHSFTTEPTSIGLNAAVETVGLKADTQAATSEAMQESTCIWNSGGCCNLLHAFGLLERLEICQWFFYCLSFAYITNMFSLIIIIIIILSYFFSKYYFLYTSLKIFNCTQIIFIIIYIFFQTILYFFSKLNFLFLNKINLSILIIIHLHFYKYN